MVDTFSPLPQTECDIIRSGIVVNHQMTCLYCAPQTKINYCFTKLNSAIEWLLSWVSHSSCPSAPSSVISLRRVAFGFSIAALQAFVAQCSGAWKKQMNSWYDLKQGSFHSCYPPKERINRHSFMWRQIPCTWQLKYRFIFPHEWWKNLNSTNQSLWRPVPHIPWSTKDIDLNLKSDC